MIVCYNSLVTTHRVHDISPILPHVVADSTCSHYAFCQGRWYLYEVLRTYVHIAVTVMCVATHIHMYLH